MWKNRFAKQESRLRVVAKPCWQMAASSGPLQLSSWSGVRSACSLWLCEMAINGVSGFQTIAAAGSVVEFSGIGSGMARKISSIISRDVRGIPMVSNIPSDVLSALVTSGVS